MTREEATAILNTEADFLFGNDKPYNRKAFDMAISALSVPGREKGTDLITLNAQGLDEGIRCAMCTNSMANDRGCDGGCVVDTAMYERVLKVIEECTVWMPAPEPYKAESKDPNDVTHIFDGVTEIPKDVFKGWTSEKMMEQIRAESEEKSE